jgi:TonB family protein
MKLIPPPSSSKQDKKITLNLSQFTPPAPQPKPHPKVTPPAPKPLPPVTPPKPVEKPVEKKPEITPKPPVKVAKKKGIRVAQKAEEDNNITQKVVKKEVKEEKKKEVAKAKPPKKVHKKKKPRKKTATKKPLPKSFHLPKKHSRDRLANALLSGKGKSNSRPATNGRPSRLIQQLYGREFYSFTKTQQKFIKDHLSEIHRITQNTLVMNGYPDVAVRTGQQGINVVSFYLHPNGDISNLRLIKRMGYEALDKNTISVIQIAYKDYPRPKTKTKIVFYVNYSLY